MAYDKLLIATGARARRLALPGCDLDGVFYLRGLDDCTALGAALQADAAVAIVGGGYIGLEVAASARKRGCRVCVLEAQGAVLSRIAGPGRGGMVRGAAPRQRRRRCTPASPSPASAARAVVSITCCFPMVAASPRTWLCIGVGAVPNVELAAAAGLPVENGIAVDDQARTADPDIFAAGDATNHPNAPLGRRIRLESWQNAQNQAIVAAAAMCGGDARYAEVPWFWSDQYDVNLQIIGLPDAWDRIVVRRYEKERSLTFAYVKHGRVIGGNALNAPRDIPVLRQLIQTRHPIDPIALADAARPLRELLPRRTHPERPDTASRSRP